MMIVPSPSTIKPLPSQQSSSTLILKNNQGSGESLSSSSSVVGHSIITKQSCEYYYPMMKNNNNTTQSSSMNDHYNQLGQRKQPQLFISCEKRRMPQQPLYAELDQNRITYQSNNNINCTLPSYSHRHDVTTNNNHHLQQASSSSSPHDRHYVAHNNKNDSHHHNNKRTRCDKNTNDDAKSTDNNRQNPSNGYQSDLVPITTSSQKRKIDNSSLTRIISEQTRSYQPMEDSTLLFLMDLVCKVVEKKEPVHSPNLSSDMISCSASSNNSHCSSPQTCLISATGKQSYSPINIESYPNNNYSNEPNNNTLSQSPSSSTLSSSTLSHNNNEKGNGINKKQPHHRTSVFTIKELLN